jgi:hypothetical protein
MELLILKKATKSVPLPYVLGPDYGITNEHILLSDPDPFDTDPDPARHFDTDPDPAFQFDLDPTV